jgi:iron complex transport system ATP-binding protein
VRAVSSPLLELRNVSVMRGDRLALRDVSLTVNRGEHVCILGPNGCGKSTLIKTLTRECYPLHAEGSSMRILGESRWDVFQLRRLLGIVSADMVERCEMGATGRDAVVSGFFGGTRVFPQLPARPPASLAMPEASPGSGITGQLEGSPELVARANAALARLGVAHLADRPVVEMSSGEAKRTLIARALVHDPETLLLDEPATALDIGAQVALTDTIRELARSGVGILLVTHHVPEIIPEIERVVLLRQGRVLADGPKGEVLTEGRLRELYGVDVRIVERDGFLHLY